MLYPQNSVDKLGFTEIKELIKAHCLSEMGQQMVDKIQVMSNYDLIHKFLSQANELRISWLMMRPCPSSIFSI